MKIPKKEQKIEKKFFAVKITAFEQRTANPHNAEQAVNVLTNTPKISNFNKGDIFRIIYSKSDEKI